MEIIKTIFDGLTAIATVILIIDLISRKRNADVKNFSERISTTFAYIQRLYSFRNIHFFNIYRYIEHKSKRQPELNVQEVAQNGLIATIKLDGSMEVVRRNLLEVYLFLKEINCLLSDDMYSVLLDKEILLQAFRSYSVNLNNFFTAAFEMVSTKEVEFGSITGFYGDFSREELVDLIESLKQNGFDFLR